MATRNSKRTNVAKSSKAMQNRGRRDDIVGSMKETAVDKLQRNDTIDELKTVRVVQASSRTHYGDTQEQSVGGGKVAALDIVKRNNTVGNGGSGQSTDIDTAVTPSVDRSSVDEVAALRKELEAAKLKLAEAARNASKAESREGECASKPASIVGGVSDPTLLVEDGVSPLTETTSDDKTKKKEKEQTLRGVQMSLLKKAIKSTTFATIKFAKDLDLSDYARTIASDYIMIKESKIDSYMRDIMKHFRRETTHHRCAVLRSFRSRFKCK
jgi:hypothetical protein